MTALLGTGRTVNVSRSRRFGGRGALLRLDSYRKWRALPYFRSPSLASKIGDMTDEIAKLGLEQAESFADRTEAVQSALDLGMSLQEIEAYLDRLDFDRSGDRLDEGHRNN